MIQLIVQGLAAAVEAKAKEAAAVDADKTAASEGSMAGDGDALAAKAQRASAAVL